MITEADDKLVREALAAAAAEEAGQPISQSVRSLIRATALTRSEQERHQLEREARARNETLTAVGLGALRVLLALA